MEAALMHSETRSLEDENVTWRYFVLSLSIEQAEQRGDYKAAIVAARETFPLLKRFVAETIKWGRNLWSGWRIDLFARASIF